MSRPTRTAKTVAIAKIKQIVEEYENVEDDIEVVAETISVSESATPEPTTPAKITLEDVVHAYKTSTYVPEIYALLPVEYRNDMMEDDIRVDYVFDIIENYVQNVSMINEDTFENADEYKIYKQAIDYYANHTEEALIYVHDMLLYFEEDCY